MELLEKRKEIDKINDEMLELFLERMEISLEIGKIKKESGLNVLSTEREKEIISKMLAKTPENMQVYVKKFFENLMQISREYQKTINS